MSPWLIVSFSTSSSAALCNCACFPQQTKDPVGVVIPSASSSMAWAVASYTVAAQGCSTSGRLVGRCACRHAIIPDHAISHLRHRRVVGRRSSRYQRALLAALPREPCITPTISAFNATLGQVLGSREHHSTRYYSNFKKRSACSRTIHYGVPPRGNATYPLLLRAMILLTRAGQDPVGSDLSVFIRYRVGR